MAADEKGYKTEGSFFDDLIDTPRQSGENQQHTQILLAKHPATGTEAPATEKKKVVKKKTKRRLPAKALVAGDGSSPMSSAETPVSSASTPQTESFTSSPMRCSDGSTTSIAFPPLQDTTNLELSAPSSASPTRQLSRKVVNRSRLKSTSSKSSSKTSESGHLDHVRKERSKDADQLVTTILSDDSDEQTPAAATSQLTSFLPRNSQETCQLTTFHEAFTEQGSESRRQANEVQRNCEAIRHLLSDHSTTPTKTMLTSLTSSSTASVEKSQIPNELMHCSGSTGESHNSVGISYLTSSLGTNSTESTQVVPNPTESTQVVPSPTDSTQVVNAGEVEQLHSKRCAEPNEAVAKLVSFAEETSTVPANFKKNVENERHKLQKQRSALKSVTFGKDGTSASDDGKPLVQLISANSIPVPRTTSGRETLMTRISRAMGTKEHLSVATGNVKTPMTVVHRVALWLGKDRSHARQKAEPYNPCTPTPPLQVPLKVGGRRLGVQMHKIMHVGIHRLIISKGDIIEFTGDAIVNAANESAISGGGVAAVIARAAGPRLNEDLKALPEVKPLVRIPVGQAKITSGYRLKVPKIIHAVGPVYSTVKIQKNQRGVAQQYDWSWLDEKLRSAYKASVGLAVENDCGAVGFSLLSTGAFCGDRGLEPVLYLGAEALADALNTTATAAPMEVHMIANGEKILRPLLKACSGLQCSGLQLNS